MAALPDVDRREIWGEMMRQHRLILAQSGNSDLTKQQIRTIIDALDDWLDSNRAEANSSIPQPERDVADASLKFQALAVVAMRRALRGV